MLGWFQEFILHSHDACSLRLFLAIPFWVPFLNSRAFKTWLSFNDLFVNIFWYLFRYILYIVSSTDQPQISNIWIKNLLKFFFLNICNCEKTLNIFTFPWVIYHYIIAITSEINSGYKTTGFRFTITDRLSK